MDQLIQKKIIFVKVDNQLYKITETIEKVKDELKTGVTTTESNGTNAAKIPLETIDLTQDEEAKEIISPNNSDTLPSHSPIYRLSSPSNYSLSPTYCPQ